MSTAEISIYLIKILFRNYVFVFSHEVPSLSKNEMILAVIIKFNRYFNQADKKHRSDYSDINF